jgi:hypothetical protein
VAVARDLEQVAPVSGNYAGAATAFDDMRIEVGVHEVGSGYSRPWAVRSN